MQSSEGMMSYGARHVCVMSIAALCLLAIPAEAGPCTKDIDRMDDRVNAWLDKMAAEEPAKRQSIGAQEHRQPTPRSIAKAEGIPSARIAKARNAMQRARQADRAGDKAACEKALAEIPPLLGE
jgi:hypothetical protein